MITGLRTAKRCRVCRELTDELGTCGDCEQDRICPDCWRSGECCVATAGDVE